MRIFFFAALLLGAFGWSFPIDLYSSSNVFNAKELYTDPSTGTHHILFGAQFASSINYWQVDPNGHVKVRLQFFESSLIGCHSGRIFGLGNGKNLYVQIMGVQKITGQNLFDQWFAESSDGGATWTPLIRVPRSDMFDSCHRSGDAVLATPEGRIFIFYHHDCPPNNANLLFVMRPPGSRIFENEREVYHEFQYNEIRPSVTAEMTYAGGTPIIHVFWGVYDSSTRLIKHSQSDNNGGSWSEPNTASDGGDYFSGYKMLTSTSNYKSAPATLMGAYAVSPPNKLRVFYSTNHGRSFYAIEGTAMQQNLYTWDFRTNSMCISEGYMYMLTQTADNEIEYSSWSLSSMWPERQQPPLLSHEYKRAYGNRLSCILKQGRTSITAVIPVDPGDSNVHLYLYING